MSAETRQHLAQTCARTVTDLGERIAGDLTLMSQVNSALAIIEIVDAVLPDAEAAARAVVSDVPGEPVALTLYREGEVVAVIALPPIRALALAARLIEAALPRLKEGKTC